MREYPCTIDNGGGEWLTFSERIQEPDGERVVGEARVAPGAGPPMHVHYHQEEAFTVIQGRLGYQIGGREPAFAAEGETVVFPAGQAHRFWNAGESDLRCSAFVKPAGNVEFFLGALFASQKANGGRRPALLDAAFLAQRYRTEFRLVEIPMIVQRLLFPVLVAVGSALGRYRKYADAPEPYGHHP
ncbi:MAG TPA: cupin domain-containing protein [Longimicrobium sp.]|jgi:quercetin dioxygenase-like cupin family protein|uniref:cupin domain-containing protein n=1 Tax=Longimicrobium sp. TaxID=2029185 RepID=UPI002ED85B11